MRPSCLALVWVVIVMAAMCVHMIAGQLCNPAVVREIGTIKPTYNNPPFQPDQFNQAFGIVYHNDTVYCQDIQSKPPS